MKVGDKITLIFEDMIVITSISDVRTRGPGDSAANTDAAANDINAAAQAAVNAINTTIELADVTEVPRTSK